MSGRTPDYVDRLESEIVELAGTDDVEDALEAAGVDPNSLSAQ